METATQQRRVPSAGPAWIPSAAYLHVPFCAHKCGYCDFASVAGQDALADDYLDALEKEIQQHLEAPRPVRTIFIGGGTPTYLSVRQLQRLMEIVHRWFDRSNLEEFTVESNPNTLDADKVNVLTDHGVNRVSLGAQSFHRELLERLERNHDPASVGRAVDLVRRRIDDVSVDLIFGVPGQSFEEWKSDLEQALALGIDHLSTYGLTFEKGTRLWRQRRLGVVQPVDEELERRMYEWAIDRLESAGFVHYEISNFARRDADRPSGARECRHNLVYWANHAYDGFGTGAAAYRQGRRSLNIRDLAAYIERRRDGRSVESQSESLEPEERARETAMLNLRRLAGLNRREFEAQTGFSIDALAGEQIIKFASWGMLADEGERIRLTREGLPLADGVLQAML